MAWKFSSSYVPRDRSVGREPHQIKSEIYKTDLNHNKWSSSISDKSKFYKNSLEEVKRSPIWSTSINNNNNNTNHLAVQKLKERYNDCSEESRKDTKFFRKTETKDLPNPKTGRVYGRSLTTLDVGEKRFDRSLNDFTYKRKKEKENKGFENKLNLSENHLDIKRPNQTSVSVFLKEKNSNNEDEAENEENMITVVTRGTSPTPTASTIYLRSRRFDYEIEKKIFKPSKVPKMVHKDIQTDREEISLSKYSVYGDHNIRPKFWGSSADNHSIYSSKFSTTFNYKGDPKRDILNSFGGHSSKEYSRSCSRSDAEEPTTPTSPNKIIGGKPSFIKRSTISPLNDYNKNSFTRENSITNHKISNMSNGDSYIKNSAPIYFSPQCKVSSEPKEILQNTNNITKNLSPKITIDHCPDIIQAIENVSSASESSEEESSTDEEPDNHSPLEKMSIKKSITNFLQNIPNTNLKNQSSPKINFRKIESGEKAWWMENGDKEFHDTSKPLTPNSVATLNTKEGGITLSPTKNFLAPPYALNKQFTVDKDWLKDEHEESRIHENEEAKIRTNEECNGFIIKNDFINSKADGYFLNTQKTVNITSAENDCCHKMKIKQQGCEETSIEDRNYLTNFPKQCSFQNSSQKLFNGIGNHAEDVNHVEGEMSGLVTKAKANLAKSKSKLDVKKSSSRETSPKIIDTSSEIDIYWQELADSLDRPLRLCDLDFTDLNSEDETDIFGNMKITSEVPPPPPMLNFPLIAPPTPFKVSKIPTLQTTDNHQPCRNRNTKISGSAPVPQIEKNKKTVRLFWKEVKEESMMPSKASQNCSLIWDELTEVKVDTQKLEYLFESRAKDLISKRQHDQNKNKEIIVLESKRSNAINIGMTKLPPPRAIKTAILKMDSTVVSKEGIEKILTMLPTEEERQRIQEAQNSNPDTPLGSAEQFLLILSSISELEARLKLWAFKLNFENNEKEICEPLMDLKQGMEILKSNKTFRGILSTLLSVGNFLNGYNVKGFQIDYLSKVPEVKDTVHKHSLLHHLCIIIMDKFPESTDLYSEIGAVTRASKVDFDELSANMKKLEGDCKLSWTYLKRIAKHEGHTTMKVKMSDFLANCAERIIVLNKIYKRIMIRFQKFAYWLGVPTNRISTTRPNEVFKIISEFALEYRTTRDRVLQQIKKMNREKGRLKGYHSNDYNDLVSRKMNSKEAKDDAKLKQLLENENTYSENSFMSIRRRQRKDTKNLLDEINKNDEEILEALVKTANQIPSTRPGLKERRRSRIYGKCCKSIKNF